MATKRMIMVGTMIVRRDRVCLGASSTNASITIAMSMRTVAAIAASNCDQWGQNAVAHQGGRLIVGAVTTGASHIVPVSTGAPSRVRKPLC